MNMEIKIKSNSKGNLIITEIIGFQKRVDLPKEYTEHVPYAILYDNGTTVLINYVGGIEEFSVGNCITPNKFSQIEEHINQCNKKLYRINNGFTLICPFCGLKNLNKSMLKNHVINYCTVFSSY